MTYTDYFHIYENGTPFKVRLALGKYIENSRPALLMLDEDSMPYAKLSTNVPDENLEDGEIIIKTYSENEVLWHQFDDFIIDTGKRYDAIHTQCPIVKIKQEMFK